jgi:hypothetical protein
MNIRLDELEAILRARICAVCRERTAEGACGRDQEQHCSLFELFPLVAQAILATDGNDIEAYVAAIRENVCPVCIEQRLDGTCPQRETMSCALDAYLGPIAEAIEEATGKSLGHEARPA